MSAVCFQAVHTTDCTRSGAYGEDLGDTASARCYQAATALSRHRVTSRDVAAA